MGEPSTAPGVVVERDGEVTTIWMNRPERRNALSLEQMQELCRAFAAAGESDSLGVILAGKGPVFSAGHDFADLAGANLDQVNTLLAACTDLMDTMQAIPQVVIARVHGLATAAGCQLVATCDLAVAAASAGFAAPGGKGGWFCTTPMVSIGRNLARKHALRARAHRGHDRRGDRVVVGPRQPGRARRRARRARVTCSRARSRPGARRPKAIGKQALYRQLGLDQPDAYAYAMEVMAAREPDRRRAGGHGVVPRERVRRSSAPAATRSAGGTSAPGQTATGGRAQTKTYCVLGTGVPGSGLWFTTTQVSWPRTRWFAS